jgi:hypothetical protein
MTSMLDAYYATTRHSQASLPRDVQSWSATFESLGGFHQVATTPSKSPPGLSESCFFYHVMLQLWYLHFPIQDGGY